MYTLKKTSRWNDYTGTYDHAKHMLIPYVGDNFFSHIGASGIAGFASASVSTPADVVKTRLMNQAGAQGSGNVYKGMAHCFTTVLREEGVFALYVFFSVIGARELYQSNRSLSRIAHSYYKKITGVSTLVTQVQRVCSDSYS